MPEEAVYPKNGINAKPSVMLSRELLKELFVRRNIYPVILSEAKNLVAFPGEMLRYAQHDKGTVAGMFLRNEVKNLVTILSEILHFVQNDKKADFAYVS